MSVLKKTISALTCAAIALTLSSCMEEQVIEDKSFSKLRFSWWGKDERNELTIEGINLFEQKEPNISVEPEYGEFAGIQVRLKSEFLSDTEADVMQINYDWLYEFSPEGEGFYDLEQLSDYIALSNFSDDELDVGRVNGKLNAIPISFNAPTFIYNKTLYAEYGLDIPKSWDDFFSAAEVMKKDGVYPLALSEKNFWLSCCAYIEQLTGKAAFDNDNKLTLTADDMKGMLDFYCKLVGENVTKASDDFNRSDFENSVTGGIVCWISDSAYYYKASQQAGFDIDIGDHPVSEGSLSFGWYEKPSSLYAIKKNTTKPEVAAKFLNFLLNDAEMSALMGTTRGIPISRSALETLEARDMLSGIEYEATTKMKNSTELKAMCPYLENADIIKVFINAANSVYYQKKTSKEAAEEAVSEMYEIMEKLHQ